MNHVGPNLINRVQQTLTPGQLFMLHMIMHEQPCTVSRLAEKMEVAPSAITAMLDRLETHSFVERIRDQSDRRVVRIKITDNGSAHLNDLWSIRQKVLTHCLLQVPDADRTVFLAVLDRLAHTAENLDITAFIPEEKD